MFELRFSVPVLCVYPHMVEAFSVIFSVAAPALVG
jgi:hypothetical protein